MLRYVVDEILSKSFDYFLKDKSGISSRSNETTTTTIGQAQSNTNSNRNEKNIRKANSPAPLRGLFSRSSRSRKASPKLLPGESKSNENSLYDELDWFREFRKGLY